MIGGDSYSPGDLPGEDGLCEALERARWEGGVAWEHAIARVAELQERLAGAEQEISQASVVLRRTLSAIHALTPVPE